MPVVGDKGVIVGNIYIPSPSAPVATSGGMWTLVDRWEPETTQDGYTFSNLDGNTDRRYKIIVARLVPANSPANVEVLIRPNGDANQNYQYFPMETSGSSVSTTSVTNYTGMTISYFPSSPAGCYEICELFAKSGDYRGMLSQFLRISGTSLSMDGSKYQIWKNTTSNITSLTIATASGSNHFGVGTSIELWKLAQ